MVAILGRPYQDWWFSVYMTSAGVKKRRTVTLYTKPGCHLCDEAKDEIELSGSAGFDLVEINIANDPDLYERYKNDIPVVLIDGVEAFRHRLNAKEFLRALDEN